MTLVIGMIVGAGIMLVGVIVGGAVAVGSQTTDKASSDIDIP